MNGVARRPSSCSPVSSASPECQLDALCTCFVCTPRCGTSALISCAVNKAKANLWNPPERRYREVGVDVGNVGTVRQCQFDGACRHVNSTLPERCAIWNVTSSGVNRTALRAAFFKSGVACNHLVASTARSAADRNSWKNRGRNSFRIAAQPESASLSRSGDTRACPRTSQLCHFI